MTREQKLLDVLTSPGMVDYAGYTVAELWQFLLDINDGKEHVADAILNVLHIDATGTAADRRWLKAVLG